MSDRPDSLKVALIGTTGRVLLDSLLHTIRFEVRSHPGYTELVEAGRPVAYALWHGRLLPLTWAHRKHDVAALISLSKDGEYIARVVEQWGYDVVRGSSSRGGRRALAEMIRHGRNGQSLAFTPDGPRGPRQKMKAGILVAAQRSGLPVVPVSAASTRAWWFEGWDRFLVPKPFSRVVVEHAAPVHIDPALGEAGIEALGLEIEATLNALQARLDAELGGTRGDAHVDTPRREDA